MGIFDGSDVPLPPNPGGKHSNHYISTESLEAFNAHVRTLRGRENKVLRYLDRCGWCGSTNDEGWRRLGLPTPNSYAPRITRLRELGLVVWRGDRRRTMGGDPAKVWVTAGAWVRRHQ